MCDCYVYSVDDKISTGDGIEVTYLKTSDLNARKKTGYLYQYRQDCPRCLDVSMLKVLDYQPQNGGIFRLKDPMLNYSEEFIRQNKLTVDSILTNTPWNVENYVGAVDRKKIILDYENLVKVGDKTQYGSWRPQLKDFLSMNPNVEFTFPEGRMLGKDIETQYNANIAAHNTVVKRHYEIESLKPSINAFLKSNNFPTVELNTFDYQKNLATIRQIWFYMFGGVPFKYNNRIYAKYDRETVESILSVIEKLLREKYNDMFNIDIKVLFPYVLPKLKFNLNETEAEIKLLTDFINEPLFRHVKNLSSPTPFITKIESTTSTYPDFNKMLLNYERKYLTDYFYNSDSEYNLTTTFGANLGTFSLEINYLTNTFIINSKDEGYLTFIPEPQSVKRLAGLPETISEFEDGTKTTNINHVKLNNSKNLLVRQASTAKNGLAFVKDSTYALKFEYNGLPITNINNKNPFKFKTRIGTKVVYLTIDISNNIRLTADPAEAVQIKLQIIKCPPVPEPSYIFGGCNNVGGYPRKNYYFPDTKGEYRFINTELLTKQYDLQDLSAYKMDTMPIDLQDKTIARAFWNKLCDEGIVVLPFPYEIGSPEYEAEGIRLCGIDKWNKKIKDKLAELAAKLENEKITISANKKAFYDNQASILQAHANNVNRIKDEFEKEMAALIADSRKDIDAQIKLVTKEYDDKKLSNTQLKTRLDGLYEKALADFERKKSEHEATVKNLLVENKKIIQGYIDTLDSLSVSTKSGFTNDEEAELKIINEKLDKILESLEAKDKSFNFYMIFILLIILFIVYHAYNKYSNIKQLLLNLLANFMTTF